MFVYTNGEIHRAIKEGFATRSFTGFPDVVRFIQDSVGKGVEEYIREGVLTTEEEVDTFVVMETAGHCMFTDEEQIQAKLTLECFRTYDLPKFYHMLHTVKQSEPQLA